MFNPKRTATFAAIVILSTAVFSGLLYREYQGLKKYMAYIAENGKSALFHEEYINQRVAFSLSTAFSATMPGKAGVNDTDTVCQHVEHINGVYGLNLVGKTFTALNGTLQTRDPRCLDWAFDVPELSVLLDSNASPSPKYSFSNYTGYMFNNRRYYIDLVHNYIYINRPVDTRHYTFQNWLVAGTSDIDIDNSAISINIDRDALKDLQSGNSIVSHIYRDGYSKKNIISMLNPVFSNGKIRGVIVTDFSISDLVTSFYTPDRPALWTFLTMYVEDNNSHKVIHFHKPKVASFDFIDHKEEITRYYTLHASLDFLYFVLTNLWLFVLYIVITLLLCQYARYQLNRHASLTKDNVTDPLTGLFNRKIMSKQLEDSVHVMIGKHIGVTVIAIDCDGLKRINDTLGHAMGDRAIKLLGKAIEKSIRKSDFGIRLGGDEFNIILVDANLNKAREVIIRVEDKLQEMDSARLVSFSWGSYQMTEQDSFETAFIKADELLYEHKQSKYTPRHR